MYGALIHFIMQQERDTWKFTGSYFIADIVKDKNPEDGEGKTPLQLADVNGHYEICRLIYAYKIKLRDAKLFNSEKKRPKKK